MGEFLPKILKIGKLLLALMGALCIHMVFVHVTLTTEEVARDTG